MSSLSSANQFRYMFLHGYQSSPASITAQSILKSFQSYYNQDIIIPDLNTPNLEKYTAHHMVEHIQEVMEKDKQDKRKWRIIGASLGGYMTSYLASVDSPKTAELIDSVILLCPAFDLHSAGWSGEFFRELSHSKPYPIPAKTISKVAILHGEQDQIIPVQRSDNYVAKIKEYYKDYAFPLELIKVTDDHYLQTQEARLKLLHLTTSMWFS
jgi:pimeloyl-ACP methyl ester carboxylesterase